MNSYHSQISRLEKEIAGLDRDVAATARKEADLTSRIAKAHSAIGKATSILSTGSKLRELERLHRNLSDLKKRQSDISNKKAQKTNSLRNYQSRQAQADATERERLKSEQRKFIDRQRQATLETRRQNSVTPVMTHQREPAEVYDFFICHASEDKDEFVRELAERLETEGAKIWYDEFTLSVGSRLRKEIDRGLAKSKFGIVVVSSHFFEKEWPQRELDGLISLDIQEESRILPIWHKVTKDEVVQHSPTLAGIYALNTETQSIEEIAKELLLKLRNSI